MALEISLAALGLIIAPVLYLKGFGGEHKIFYKP